MNCGVKVEEVVSADFKIKKNVPPPPIYLKGTSIRDHILTHKLFIYATLIVIPNTSVMF